MLAILFVLIGAIPIVWWLGSWLLHSATHEQIVQAVLIVVILYFAWWMRKRLKKK
ncbi:MAG TPA: hypothetical protein VEH53_03100 [archaeon]|nr:hypothetical protein [archaeon]